MAAKKWETSPPTLWLKASHSKVKRTQVQIPVLLLTTVWGQVSCPNPPSLCVLLCETGMPVPTPQRSQDDEMNEVRPHLSTMPCVRCCYNYYAFSATFLPNPGGQKWKLEHDLCTKQRQHGNRSPSTSCNKPESLSKPSLKNPQRKYF